MAVDRAIQNPPGVHPVVDFAWRDRKWLLKNEFTP